MPPADIEVASLRVLIVDNHPILRGGLAAVIAAEPGMGVIGEASDGLEAIHLAEALHPDLVIMDLSMPTLDGIEATRRIKASRPTTRVLVLSAHREASNVQAALHAGASGYLLKRGAARDVIVALRAIADGGTFLDPSAAASAAERQTTLSSTPPPALSKREAEVIKLIARGYAMKEIAASLDVSARTLETYKARAMEKLGLRTRPDLVRYAAVQGWLDGSHDEAPRSS